MKLNSLNFTIFNDSITVYWKKQKSINQEFYYLIYLNNKKVAKIDIKTNSERRGYNGKDNRCRSRHSQHPFMYEGQRNNITFAIGGSHQQEQPRDSCAWQGSSQDAWQDP